MKTTLDIPDSLMRQVKIRAVREGRKLKDEVADLLRKGLAAAAAPASPVRGPVVGSDRKTGLPDVNVWLALSLSRHEFHEAAGCRA